MKTCTGCKQALPESSFYAHPTSLDGLFYKCKPCHRAEVSARQHAQKRGDWKPKGRRLTTHDHTRSATKYAARTGKLVAADACTDCGQSFAAAPREKHHPDYSNPLDIVWLCRRCHNRRHPSRKAIEFLERIAGER